MSDDRPQSTVQAAGRVADDVISGLKPQPLLLGIVVLNVIGICAALYFLNLLANNNAAHLGQIMAQHGAQFESMLKLCAPRNGT